VEQNPQSFAQALGSLKQTYRIVVKYRTIRGSGYSEWKKLIIKIDTRDFVKNIVEYWRENPQFSHLADLADPNHEIA